MKWKLRRSECTVLPLVLKGKWYDMIASGEKREEYREYKDFWIKRIEKWQDDRIDKLSPRRDRKPDIIAFSRGYKKPDIFFLCDYILIRKDTPLHPDWGEPSIKHFVLGLGERIELVD